MSDGERTSRQYDAMAVAYAEDNAGNAFNAHYERPATVALLESVVGRRVLEVGCGAGPLTEWLVDEGAVVTAIDVSSRMLELASARLGGRASFRLADIHHPLSFAVDGSFDVVVASLVLHYVRDWEPVLLELRRVLSPDGSVVFSTHHPAMDWALHTPDDYFAVSQVTEVWSKGSQEFDVTFWRRPLTAMTQAIAGAGFLIERLVEPAPLPGLREKDPSAYALLSTRPQFLFFRLRPAG